MPGASIDLLKKNSLCQGMTEAEVQILAGCFTDKEMKVGTTVFIENMPGESLYLIRQGVVKITRMLGEGDEQILLSLGSGDVFGEMAVLDGGARSATARVAQDAHLLRMDRSDFEALGEKNPHLAFKLMRNIVRVFCRRLREKNEEYRQILLLTLGRKA